MKLDQSQQHLIAGTGGGLIATVSLYPLELLKVRMQVTDRNGKYRTLFSTFRSVVSQEGVRGFYRGMTPAVIAASGSWGGYFYFYEKSKTRKLKDEATTKLGVVDHLLSGVEAGVILVFMFNPLWLVKTRLALQGGGPASQLSSKQYTGMSDALRTIVREEGVKGLYKGLVPALFLTSHGAIQFAVYEYMKVWADSFKNKTSSVSTSFPVSASPVRIDQAAWLSMMIGGGSKILASVITYPYQVVKSRLQQRMELGPDKRGLLYSNTFDCFIKIVRNEGFTGLFRGVVPNALKVAPSAAITFVVYEETMKILHKLNP